MLSWKGCNSGPNARSAPLLKDQLWPNYMLAKAFVDEHLGTSVLPMLERAIAVQEPSTAAPEMRPRASDHLKSLRIEPPALRPGRVVIVDDVVTRGATMLAAISALSDAIPGAQVEGFALFRTQSTEDCTAIWSPRGRESACSKTEGHGGGLGSQSQIYPGRRSLTNGRSAGRAHIVSHSI